MFEDEIRKIRIGRHIHHFPTTYKNSTQLVLSLKGETFRRIETKEST